jgi:hypothetical protein
MKLNNYSNYEHFVNYCLEQLGSGAVKIEITEKQILNRISDAIQYYSERHFDGSQEDILIIDLQRDQRYYDIGDFIHNKIILSVISELRSASLTDWFMRNALVFANQSTPVSLFSNFRNLDNLFMTTQFIDFMKGTFQATNTFNFNYTQQRLTLLNNPITEEMAAAKPAGSKRAFRVYTVEGFSKDSDGSLVADSDIFNNTWFKHYCTAQLKLQWGQNLSKYGDITLPGGMTIKADKIKDEAKEELKELEEQLVKRYKKPTPMIFG